MKSISMKTGKSALLENWRSGPIGDLALEPGHDRPIYCMSIYKETLVTGSADHGLRVYDLAKGEFKRELFGKKYGHKEWITTCHHLQDGRLLSGGMDSMLCLWDATGVRCDHIKSHDASIAKVMTDERNVGISASYDTSLMIWDLDSKTDAMRLAGEHKGPVLEFDWHNSLVASGDKNGLLIFWDINRGEPVKKIQCHKGAISKIMLYSDLGKHNYVISAGVNVNLPYLVHHRLINDTQKDGMLCVHDLRTHEPVYVEQLHRGAINDIKINDAKQIVTGSADKTCMLIDMGSGFKKYGKMDATDAVFVLETIYNITLAGTGDGNVLAFDNDTQECLYGYGVLPAGGVRCLKKTDDQTRLVAAGDDTKAMILYYL